jgi:hypothetical protein
LLGLSVSSNECHLCCVAAAAAAAASGRNADGDAWRESWTERLMYASNDLDCVVERNAHKWAAQGNVSSKPEAIYAPKLFKTFL